jgi:DNA-binding TFAR19-related protein (PDSD5 family)
MKNYVADELSNKVYHLTKALAQAERIADVLQIENENLKDALNNLASENKEDYSLPLEAYSEQIYATQA